MRVAPEVPNDLFGAAEGTLAVHHPLESVQFAHEPSKLRRPEPRATIRPVQLALSIGLRDRIEQLALEKFAHHGDRKQEVASCRLPLRAILRQTSAGHDAMHVGVKAQIAGPSVQHDGDAELRAEAFGTSAKREQRGARSIEQLLVEEDRMQLRQRGK